MVLSFFVLCVCFVSFLVMLTDDVECSFLSVPCGSHGDCRDVMLQEPWPEVDLSMKGSKVGCVVFKSDPSWG